MMSHVVSLVRFKGEADKKQINSRRSLTAAPNTGYRTDWAPQARQLATSTLWPPLRPPLGSRSWRHYRFTIRSWATWKVPMAPYAPNQFTAVPLAHDFRSPQGQCVTRSPQFAGLRHLAWDMQKPW